MDHFYWHVFGQGDCCTGFIKKKPALEGVILVVIVVLELVTRRFFYRSFCPLGGMLSFIGHKRRLQVKVLADVCTGCGKCVRVCPMGLEPQNTEGQSPYCWNCGDCIDTCPDNALQFSWKKN